MRESNKFNVPSFLKAKSAEELRSLMLKNNLKLNQEFEYFDIQFAGNSWYAWFYISLDSAQIINEKTNDVTKKQR
jgi:hypothetical protein